MKRYASVFLQLLIAAFTIYRPQFSAASDKEIINNSRKSCVQVSYSDGHGTGFFIGKQYVATCFHVVAAPVQHGSNIDLNVHHDIKVTTETGETIDADCITIPSNQEPEPYTHDFAILKLKSPPKSKPAILAISADSRLLEPGDQATFSGFPLEAPTMLTHLAMVSGVTTDGDLICLQAPVNKGNSGRALVSTNGQVVGIITLREGHISQALHNLSETINSGEVPTFSISGGGSASVNPIQSIGDLVGTLDTYISTGIGYARSTKFLKTYLAKHPDLLQ